MSAELQPVVLSPSFHAKPWGGRSLSTLLDKALPGADPIGESWEVASLPDFPQHDSPVRDGPLAGTRLATLVETWKDRLYGDAALADGRFPLLLKYLDAREHLSVQVHPKPAPDGGDVPGIKHEAWYVVAADADARLYIGLKPGVGPDDVAAAFNTKAFADLLLQWPAEVGQCYYLPSGTVHALGAGLVVAEVQTPSDITYRLYDWERVGLDGKPRTLHLEQGAANTRYDITRDMIAQPRAGVPTALGPGERVAATPRFTIDRVDVEAGTRAIVLNGQMRLWMTLSGSGRLSGPTGDLTFGRGDTVLLPAACEDLSASFAADAQLLEVGIPV